MKSTEKLITKISQQKHICVGLDTDFNKIPKSIQSEKNSIFEFNKRIIEQTHEFSAAYKINFAFYEKLGSIGFEILSQTMEIIPKDIFVIGDAKRGDIGNTAQMYAESLFEYFNFDASTINPLMGIDSAEPFLNYSDKLHFVLSLTSNPSSSEFEKLKLENGKYLYEEIISKAIKWSENVGFVFGATNYELLKKTIPQFENRFVLLPGVGTQGGSLKDVVAEFYSQENRNFVINVSRDIIYAGNDYNFDLMAKERIIFYNNAVNKIIDEING